MGAKTYSHHCIFLVIATLSLTMGLYFFQKIYHKCETKVFLPGYKSEKQDISIALHVILLPSRKSNVEIKGISFVIFLSSGERKLRYGGGVPVCSGEL